MKGDIVAIVTYVIPAGECPKKTKCVESVNGGRDESVRDFYERICQLTSGADLLTIELKEVQ